MDTIKETKPPIKRVEVEYVVFNPKPLQRPIYLRNFGEDNVVINYVNLKRGTYVKEIITKNKT